MSCSLSIAGTVVLECDTIVNALVLVCCRKRERKRDWEPETREKKGVIIHTEDRSKGKRKKVDPKVRVSVSTQQVPGVPGTRYTAVPVV